MHVPTCTMAFETWERALESRKKRAAFSEAEKKLLQIAYDDGMNSTSKEKRDLIQSMSKKLGREEVEIKVQ